MCQLQFLEEVAINKAMFLKWHSLEATNDQFPKSSDVTLSIPFYKSVLFFLSHKTTKRRKIDCVRMSGYSDFTTRSIKSITELKPGDHIRVPGTGNKSLSSFSSISSYSTSTFPTSTSTSTVSTSRLPASTSCGSSSRGHHESDELPEPKHLEKCEGKTYTHHLLFVKVVKEKFVEVIHKVKFHNIIRELKWYRPEDITVLDYKSTYTGEYAVTRAKEMKKRGEKYHATKANCEHFVAEVRTGKKQCFQIRNVAAVGAVGGGAGAVGIGAGGAGVGALIGGGIGSVFPVVGTLIGAGVGGTIGGAIGAVLGLAAGGAGGAVGGFKRANRDIEGKKQCYQIRNTGKKQIRNVAAVGAVGGGVGAVGGGAGGAGVGALIGVGIGSIVPGAGTLIGAGVGATIGGVVGASIGGGAGAAGGVAGGIKRANRDIED